MSSAYIIDKQRQRAISKFLAQHTQTKMDISVMRVIGGVHSRIVDGDR